MKTAIRFTAASLVLAVAAAIAWLILPTYSAGFGAPSKTLVEVNGQWVIGPVMFPVVIALVPVIFPARAMRLVAAALMGGFTVVGSFTIGLFYLPASLLMLMAAVRNDEGAGLEQRRHQ
jgi:hypothetical protein